MMINRVVACGIAVTLLAGAQEPPGSLSFEVASVKVDTDDSLPAFVTGRGEMRIRFQGGPGTRTPERLNYRGATLKMLIQRAYGMASYQVLGPSWLDKQRYTVIAKLPPKTTREECNAMLRNLLSERFDLRFHSENKSFRVYRLVVSNEGPKLASAQTLVRPDGGAQDPSGVASNFKAQQQKTIQDLGFNPTNHLFSTDETMAELAERLTEYVDRPVIDTTHLSGHYSFSLGWVADGVRQDGDQPYGPSLLEALRKQLGLELSSATDQLHVLIVDAASRTPTAN